MAIEPLNTDEKLDKAAPRERDFDTKMMVGCGGFLIAAVVGYLLSVWPFVAFMQAERLSTVAMSLALGLLPAAILGLVATRRFGVAGACGFVAGAIVTSVFLYLRLTQAFLAAMARQTAPPDYPRSLAAIIPILWVLLAATLAFMAMPKGELD